MGWVGHKRQWRMQNKNWPLHWQTMWPELPPPPHTCTQTPSRVCEKRCRFFHSSASGKPHLTFFIKKISKVFFIILFELIISIVENLVAHQYPSFVYSTNLHNNELKFDTNWRICRFSVCFIFREDSKRFATQKGKIKNTLRIEIDTGSSRKIEPLKIT